MKSVGLSGQMHGLVMLDRENAVIRPALIWRPGEYELRLSLVVRGDDPGTPYPTWAFPAVKKLIVK